jgi:hypothetical protein
MFVLAMATTVIKKQMLSVEKLQLLPPKGQHWQETHTIYLSIHLSIYPFIYLSIYL